MAIDWKCVYTAALTESHPDKALSACNHAREVINDRALEIGTEMKELEEALRQLFIHQVEKSGIAP